MQAVVVTANRYADNRLFQLSKGNTRFKVNARELRQEIVNASVFGELSALERIMAEIVADKELTRDDIEAKLHLAIVELYNVMRDKFDMGPLRLNLEQYLSLRGYYGKDSVGSVVIEQ
jgi:hypothetical protein